MEDFSPENNPIYHADVLQSLATCLNTLPQGANSGIWNDNKQNQLNSCMNRYFDASIASAKGFNHVIQNTIELKHAFGMPEFDA